MGRRGWVRIGGERGSLLVNPPTRGKMINLMNLPIGSRWPMADNERNEGWGWGAGVTTGTTTREY